jgi:hypothetical protein
MTHTKRKKILEGKSLGKQIRVCKVYFVLHIRSANILYIRVLPEYGVFFMAG